MNDNFWNKNFVELFASDRNYRVHTGCNKSRDDACDHTNEKADTDGEANSACRYKHFKTEQGRKNLCKNKNGNQSDQSANNAEKC